VFVQCVNVFDWLHIHPPDGLNETLAHLLASDNRKLVLSQNGQNLNQIWSVMKRLISLEAPFIPARIFCWNISG
jgi:hypothetical protein